MAESLISKLINEEIAEDDLITWLLDNNCEPPKTENVIECNRTEFLYYFLNYIHKDIPCGEKHSDSVQKKSKKNDQSHEPSTYIKRRTNFGQSDERKNSTNISNNSKFNSSDNNILNNSLQDSISPMYRTFNSRMEISNSSSYKIGLNSTINSQKSDSFFETSTPKIIKIQSDTSIDSISSLNSSQMSPISPLVRPQNCYVTPKPTKRPFFERGLERASPLCLGDFIVTRKTSNNKKKTLKPIACNGKQTEKSANSFNFTENEFKSEESDHKSTSLRSVVSSEKIACNSFNFTDNGSKTEGIDCKLLISSSFKDSDKIGNDKYKESNCKGIIVPKENPEPVIVHEIEPDVDKVTFKQEMDHLVKLYVIILDNDLIPNKISELYFIISLLLSKQVTSKDPMDMGVHFLEGSTKKLAIQSETLKISSLFKNINNIVYFAANTLKTQINVLKTLDKQAFKLMMNNQRLNTFVPEFVKELTDVFSEVNERIVETFVDDSQTNVCFKSDTDNRANFPNDASFNAFRKQRDLFYDILHTWNNNHLLPGWDFESGLAAKIKSLMNFHSEPANFMHFARLFTAQLLKSESKQLHSTMPNVDTDKLNKLLNRMTVNSSADQQNGINSVPAFTGHQEFYKEFIFVASSPEFNRHLYDCLAFEINCLNDSNFLGSEHTENDNDVEISTRKSYISCVKSLKVLAKFLGFVESLPYVSKSNVYNGALLSSQLSARRKTCPNFDIKKLLLQAIKEGKLVLTLPWLTEYLAMLDYVSLRLPYYIELINILIETYHRFCLRSLQTTSISRNSIPLLKFCLGWLFELPHFPQDRYYHFTTNYKKFTQKIDNPELKSPDKSNQITLDALEIVDINVMYTCCPYLDEMRKLLSTNISSVNTVVTMRHMTTIPISNIQSQLEEAFFNGHPNSVRKTVEFVSERITSSCVKHLCYFVVPAFKKETIDKFKCIVDGWWKEENLEADVDEEGLEMQKSRLRVKAEEMAAEALKELLVVCEKEMVKIASEKIPASIEALLALDSVEEMKETCVLITTKMCIERVKQWITAQVTTAIFLKDFDNETQRLSPSEPKKKPVFLLPVTGSDKIHNPDSLSAVEVLEKIREASINLLENETALTENEVVNLTSDVLTTLTERIDVNECISASICSQLVDYVLLLITQHPEFMNDKVFSRLGDIWKLYYTKPDELFAGLLSPRNIMIFAQSGNAAQTWETFARFIAFLIKEEQLLSCDDFESQCIGVFKTVLHESTLHNLTEFFNKFLAYYRKNGGSQDRFTFIIDFLANYCVDL